MQLQSVLTLLAVAAATPALAQCRGGPTKTTIRCSDTVRDTCDESRLVSQCPPGQQTQWRFIDNRCFSFDVCEYEVRGFLPEHAMRPRDTDALVLVYLLHEVGPACRGHQADRLGGCAGSECIGR